MTTPPSIVVSGMRPTGRLHLGHWHGVIENWVRFQSDAAFAGLYFFIADYHALTTEYQGDPGAIRTASHDMILDWMAFGVDPEKSTCFVQSLVPEHAELHLLLSMVTPVSWLTRVPSYKDVQKELSGRDLSTYGFLGYPLLQTADVAIYGGTHVPVGQDQVAHIELSREIVRRFNHNYGADILVEPKPLLTAAGKVPGTDGRKMSKSYANSVYLADTPEEIRKKIMPMLTDPARMRRTDPGDPDKCPVFDYHRIHTGADKRAEIDAGCRSAGIGCVDCKKVLLEGMLTRIKPHQARRAELAAKSGLAEEVLMAGSEHARKIARLTLDRVRHTMGL